MKTATKLTDKEKLALIQRRIDFARENPSVPFLFSCGIGFNPELTNAQDKNMVGTAMFPAVTRLNFDAGDGLKQHIVIFKDTEPVQEAHAFYRNNNGKFEEPELKMLEFENYKISVYGDSLKSLCLMEYLSLCEMFEGSIKCQDLTETIKDNGTANTLMVEDIVKYVAVIDELAKSENGFALLKSIAKNPKLNPNYSVVDGLEKMENGKEQIVSIVKQFLANPEKSKVFVKEFLPSEVKQNLIVELLQKEILAYNEQTKSYQLKIAGKYDKDLLYTIDSKNEATRIFMFAHNMQAELQAKLQNILAELK